MDKLILAYIKDVNLRNRVMITEWTLTSKLSPETVSGINKAYRLKGMKTLGQEIGRIHTLPNFLEDCPDDPAIFPKGKWATIQRVQELVLGAA